MSDLDHHSRRVPSVLVLLAVLMLSGCVLFDSSGSFSDSSGSLSDASGSVSRSTESSSDSSASSSGEDDQAYLDDVRDFTIATARVGGRPDVLRRGLSEIALGRGISDWEAVGATYAAVGEGLARAGVTEERLLAYQTEIARPGSDGFDAIGLGYAAALP